MTTILPMIDLGIGTGNKPVNMAPPSHSSSPSGAFEYIMDFSHASPVRHVDSSQDKQRYGP